jgi:hypothetical protein
MQAPAPNDRLVRLLQTDDLVLAERVADFLESEGIEVFTRASHEMGGLLGSPGVRCIVEVSQNQVAQAQEMLKTFDKPETSEETALSPASSTPGIQTLSVYQLAASIHLGFDLVVLVIATLQDQLFRLMLIRDVIFDCIIWVSFRSTDLSFSTAKRLRIFALFRVAVGIPLALFTVPDVGLVALAPLAVLAYVGFLYSRPVVASQAVDTAG